MGHGTEHRQNEAMQDAAERTWPGLSDGSPRPEISNEHLAFVAVMNALDIHMPPDGQNLLNELRQIAATVGYPWGSALLPSSEEG